MTIRAGEPRPSLRPATRCSPTAIQSKWYWPPPPDCHSEHDQRDGKRCWSTRKRRQSRNYSPAQNLWETACIASSNLSIHLPKFTKVNATFRVTRFQQVSSCKTTQIAQRVGRNLYNGLPSRNQVPDRRPVRRNIAANFELSQPVGCAGTFHIVRGVQTRVANLRRSPPPTRPRSFGQDASVT